MGYLKEIREKLCLSQHELAALIGCQRGHLSMAESNKRQLPLASRQALQILEAIGDRSTPAKAKGLQAASPEETILLEKTIRVNGYKLESLELRNETLEEQIVRTDTILAATAVLSKLKKMPELASLELEVMQRRAEERRTRLRERWVRCQLEMAGLQAALKKARQLKNG